MADAPPAHDLTLADFDDPAFVAKISAEIEGWLPNHVDSEGRVDSLDDLIDRVEGAFQMPSGDEVTLILGNDVRDPAYVRLRRLAAKIAKEARE